MVEAAAQTGVATLGTLGSVQCPTYALHYGWKLANSTGYTLLENGQLKEAKEFHAQTLSPKP
jgi:hypothetical protein